MSRRLLGAFGGGGVIVVVILLGTGLGWWNGATTQTTASTAIAVSTSLTPSSTLFADPVTAKVVVALAAKHVTLATLSVQPDFSPYVVSAAPAVQRTRDGAREIVSYSYSLECDTDGCLPASGPAVVHFRPVVVGVQEAAKRVTATGSWPALTVSSRLQSSDLHASTPPFRRPSAAPPVVFGIDPSALADGLTAAAGLLGLIALALGGLELAVVVSRRRRGTAPGPLESALALVRQAAGREDAADRRKALELLSEALMIEGRPALAASAGNAAWAPPAPSPARALELADEAEAGTGIALAEDT